MSIHQPLQRRDGRWDYTITNSAGTMPAGRCAGEGPHGHADGHATADEAERCYREHELETVREYDASNCARPCAVCAAWTPHRVQVGTGLGRVYDLCPTHATREHIAAVHLHKVTK